MKDKFCGWYFRAQSDAQTLALIPALHTTQGERTGSLQIISDDGSRMIAFTGANLWVDKKRPRALLGQNLFSARGIRLAEKRADITLCGTLRFGRLSPIGYDIMGPFCYVPMMECRHSVISMRHAVDGRIWLDGKEYRFQNARGYIEGDRGCSFPRRYAWTQCFFENGSLMLSVADIPMGGICFTGIIGVIRFGGKEYRLATYLGARAVTIGGGRLEISQGDLSFTAALLEKNSFVLKAPKVGDMSRSIRESLTCRAAYRFCIGGRTVLDFETERAAFEYEYPI